MIYRLFRPITRLACLIYFRRIYLLNAEKVPLKGPLLIVCNHPAAFLEACLLAALFRRPLYFLTRGDFFRNAFFSWLLRQTHQIPIYRTLDGFGKMRSNRDTFDKSFQALAAGKAVMIFPESVTELEKRLRPLKKGAARLALGAVQKTGQLNILPVGVTFSEPRKFRGIVTVVCGDPVTVLAANDGEDLRATTQRLTAQLEEVMRSLVLHIDAKEDEQRFDTLLPILINDHVTTEFPVISTDPDILGLQRALANKVQHMPADEIARVQHDQLLYAMALDTYRWSDRFFLQHSGWSTLHKAGALLLLPVIVSGKINIFIPAGFTERFIRRRIRRPPFHAAVKWVMGFVVFALWMLILLLAGLLIAGLPGILVALVWCMTGYLVLRHFHDVPLRSYWRALNVDHGVIRKLHTLRARLNRLWHNHNEADENIRSKEISDKLFKAEEI